MQSEHAVAVLQSMKVNVTGSKRLALLYLTVNVVDETLAGAETAQRISFELLITPFVV